ncbi:MAG: SpoIID/LytB domain-containing protein [Phycisphaerales bacterium]|nr:SpoIID/LytB domain-containing protein [Phycisphaerales bacterium]
MFRPGKTNLKKMARGATALAGSHFEHPGSPTMAVLLAIGLIVSLVVASCQLPNRTRAMIGPSPSTWDASGVWMGAEPEIRVRIAKPTKELVVGGPRLVLAREASGRVRIFRTPVLIGASAGSVVLTETGGEPVTIAGHVELESGDPRPSTRPRPGTLEAYADAPTIAVQGVEYAGAVRITAEADGVQAINYIDLEPYVAAVASRELYPSWSLAAYEAQTIAARSYALQSMSLPKFRDRAWDVESSTVDQAYPGHTNHQRSIQAVINTRGRVVAYRGKILRTYYSSTSGGRSGSAADTWPTEPGFEYNLLAPIQAHNVIHASEASRFHRWEVVRTTDDVTKRLRAWGERAGHSLKNARAVTNISVHRLNRADRPSTYRVGERNGVSHTLSAEQLRIALNQDVKGLPDASGDRRVRSGDFEVTAAGSRLVIRGRGFGHGVGMCQFSAQALSKRGWTADDILKNFYPGASIELAY